MLVHRPPSATSPSRPSTPSWSSPVRRSASRGSLVRTIRDQWGSQQEIKTGEQGKKRSESCLGHILDNRIKTPFCWELEINLTDTARGGWVPSDSVRLKCFQSVSILTTFSVSCALHFQDICHHFYSPTFSSHIATQKVRIIEKLASL